MARCHALPRSAPRPRVHCCLAGMQHLKRTSWLRKELVEIGCDADTAFLKLLADRCDGIELILETERVARWVDLVPNGRGFTDPYERIGVRPGDCHVVGDLHGEPLRPFAVG